MTLIETDNKITLQNKSTGHHEVRSNLKSGIDSEHKYLNRAEVLEKQLASVEAHYKDAAAGIHEKGPKQDFERYVTDLRAELVQTKERLAQEIADHARVKEQFQALSTSLEERVAERTRALAALYGLMVVANHAESLEHLLDEALVQVMSALQCETGMVMLFDAELEQPHSSVARVIVEHSNGSKMPHKQGCLLTESDLFADLIEITEPLLILDTSQDERLPVRMRQLKVQLLLAPIRFDDRIQGVVGLLRPAGPAPAEDNIAMLSLVTNQMGVAIQQLELRKEAQQRKLLAERERLGRDLHDTITQSLYGLAALSEAGEAQLEASESGNASRIFKRIGQTVRQALREMRLFIHDLRPGILEQHGLVAALQLRLEAVEGRADTQVRLTADDPLPLPQDVEHALYRITQESLNNIMRHANAKNVTVLLRRVGNEVILEVADDGIGFDPEQVSNGRMGLANMRLYASEIGAKLQVSSAAKQGTTVRVVVPTETKL